MYLDTLMHTKHILFFFDSSSLAFMSLPLYKDTVHVNIFQAAIVAC